MGPSMLLSTLRPTPNTLPSMVNPGILQPEVPVDPTFNPIDNT